LTFSSKGLVATGVLGVVTLGWLSVTRSSFGVVSSVVTIDIFTFKFNLPVSVCLRSVRLLASSLASRTVFSTWLSSICFSSIVTGVTGSASIRTLSSPLLVCLVSHIRVRDFGSISVLSLWFSLRSVANNDGVSSVRFQGPVKTGLWIVLFVSSLVG